MNKTIKFLVNKSNDGKRVDIFLSDNLSLYTRSYIKRLIENRKLKINSDYIIKSSTKIKANDKIQLNISEVNKDNITSNKIALDIVHEDNDLLVINKPKGLVVHPGAGNYKNTLANGLVYKYKKNLSDINGSLRPGIVHRIDKETSGLLVVAKNNFAHSNLSEQFSNHTIKRKYQCLIWGVIRPLGGRIETLITRDKKNRQIMTVSDFRGKKAITNYKTIKTFNLKDIPKISFVECELETGRTHQIRVHLKHKGTSLLGDTKYGGKKNKFKKINQIFLKKLNDIKGQALHAQTLEFTHPKNNKRLNFKSDLPRDFKKMLDFLKNLEN